MFREHAPHFFQLWASQNPISIISLVSHCSKPPDPDPDLVSSTTDEEVDLKQWIAEFHEQLRIDRTKILDKLRQDFRCVYFASIFLSMCLLACVIFT